MENNQNSNGNDKVHQDNGNHNGQQKDHENNGNHGDGNNGKHYDKHHTPTTTHPLTFKIYGH